VQLVEQHEHRLGARGDLHVEGLDLQHRAVGPVLDGLDVVADLEALGR
jgi:hypothetical protein